MIFPGHRRKAIEAKFVNIGPLIIIIIIIIVMIIIIMIIIIIIIIIIITHLNKSRLTSDFKFQLLISAPHSVNCLAGIIPTDMWPP